MAGAPLPIEMVLRILGETSSRISTLTVGVAPAALRASPGPDEWSANDVLAHLRACADVWGDCIAATLDEDEPTLRAINPTTWIATTDYLELELRPSLRSFGTQRAELLAVLGPLPDEGWTRAATATGAGRNLKRTVLFYADWMARHERPHVRQIKRIVDSTKLPLVPRP